MQGIMITFAIGLALGATITLIADYLIKKWLERNGVVYNFLAGRMEVEIPRSLITTIPPLNCRREEYDGHTLLIADDLKSIRVIENFLTKLAFGFVK